MHEPYRRCGASVRISALKRKGNPQRDSIAPRGIINGQAPTAEALLGVGEVARRTGVSPTLLRAWERRYGLLDPRRSPGGRRLYTELDVERVLRTREYMRAGLSTAQAARLAMLDGARSRVDRDLADTALELGETLERYAESEAHALLDRALTAFGLEAVLAELVLPALARLGERWAAGEVSVAQEHFASTLLRTRLLALARGWDQGVGPRALLGCLPGELHDIGLIAFGLALRNRGWRVTYLGQDVPLATIHDAAEAVEPAVVVLSASAAERVLPVARALARLAGHRRVALGGKGARAASRRRAVEVLPADPVEAAEALTVTVASG